MYLSVHGLAGALIGSQITNPFWAFLLSVISHFILDAIPHDITEIKDWRARGNFKKRFAVEALIDFSFLLFVLAILWQKEMLPINLSILAGITGAILPDFIWGGAELFNIENKAIEAYKKFHGWAHRVFLPEGYLPLKYAGPIQAVTWIIILFIYLTNL